MPDLEELLARLEAEGDDGSDPDAGTAQSGGSDNPTIQQIREAQKKARKDAQDLAKALKEAQAQLADYQAKEKTSALEAAFSKFDLPEGVSALARKAYDGEPTEDAVKQFLVDLKVLDENASAEVGGTTESKSQGFEPGGTGQGGSSASGKMPRKEWLELGRTNQAEAERLFLAGRVDLSDVDALKAHDQA